MLVPAIMREFKLLIQKNPNGETPAIQVSLIDFLGGRAYGCSLTGFGINAD